MSDIVSELRRSVVFSQYVSMVSLAAKPGTILAAADEIERLRREAESFHMEYRMKCDEATKPLHVEIERLRERLAEVDQVNTELVHAEAVISADRDMLKGLLREVAGCNVEDFPELRDRIDAALGTTDRETAP